MDIDRRALFGLGISAAAVPMVGRAGLAESPKLDKWDEPPREETPPSRYPFPMIPDAHNIGPWPVFCISKEEQKKGFLPKVFFMRVSEKIKHAPYPYMSLTINSIQITPTDLERKRTIQQLYETLDLVKIPNHSNPKHFCFEINRQMSDIARKSRRGRGNLFLYRQLPAMMWMTPNVAFMPMDWTENYHCDGILAYRGVTIYDRPFIGIKGMPGTLPGEIFWVAHPDYKKYARRWIL